MLSMTSSRRASFSLPLVAQLVAVHGVRHVWLFAW
jgi:hypothetical protein